MQLGWHWPSDWCASMRSIHLYDSAAHATWIHTYAAAEWLEFKCRVITQFVHECSHRIRKAGQASLAFGLYTLPLAPGDLASIAGQHLEDLAPLVDGSRPWRTTPFCSARRPGWQR